MKGQSRAADWPFIVIHAVEALLADERFLLSLIQ